MHENHKEGWQDYFGDDYWLRIRKKGLFPVEKKAFKLMGLSKGQHILDAGCGGGRTSEVLALMGMQVTAIDINEEIIEKAKKDNLHNVNYLTMSVTNLNFPDNCFDTVIFPYNGLIYITDKHNQFLALKELARVLKPNGFFMMCHHSFWGQVYRQFFFRKNCGLLSLIFRRQVREGTVLKTRPLFGLTVKRWLRKVGFTGIIALYPNEFDNLTGWRRIFKKVIVDEHYWVAKKRRYFLKNSYDQYRQKRNEFLGKQQ